MTGRGLSVYFKRKEKKMQKHKHEKKMNKHTETKVTIKTI